MAPAVFDGAPRILMNKMLGNRKVLTKPLLQTRSYKTVLANPINLRLNESRMVQRQARPHRSGQRDLLEIDTFRSTRLETLEVCYQGFQVATNGVSFEINLAQRGMDNTVLVSPETHLTRFGILYCGRHIRSHSAHLGVGHQATRTQDLAQLTDNTHGIRRSDHHVKVELTLLDPLSQVIHADDIGTGFLSSFGVGTLGKHGDANILAGSVGHYGSATHHLVRLARINTQVDGNVQGLLELDRGELGEQSHGFFERVGLGGVNFLANHLCALGKLSHVRDPPR